MDVSAEQSKEELHTENQGVVQVDCRVAEVCVGPSLLSPSGTLAKPQGCLPEPHFPICEMGQHVFHRVAVRQGQAQYLVGNGEVVM